jgi:DNA-binding transcriptional LysR family regulator
MTHIVPFVAPVVTQFLATYPSVKVELMMGESSIDLIDEGFDVAIRLIPPPDSSLIVRSLTTWRHVLCCSQSYGSAPFCSSAQTEGVAPLSRGWSFSSLPVASSATPRLRFET